MHFIKLHLFNEKGKEIASTFYWRSTDKYEGAKTLTGPAASGFESLSELPQTSLKVKYRTRQENGRYFIDVEVKNHSKTLAFFTQLQFLNEKEKPVRPSFYTDNFFSLLPGETKNVTIETASHRLTRQKSLVVKGWNVKKQVFRLK